MVPVFGILPVVLGTDNHDCGGALEPSPGFRPCASDLG